MRIPALHVGAVVLWCVGLVLSGLWTFAEIRTGSLGVVVACMGGVMNIRVFVGRLEERERRAFDFGRQVGEASPDVPRLHDPGRSR